VSAVQGASGTIALVGTLAYVLSFALGAGAVPGVLVSEINPAAIRGELQLTVVGGCGKLPVRWMSRGVGR